MFGDNFSLTYFLGVFMKKFFLFLILLIIMVSCGFVSASENKTDVIFEQDTIQHSIDDEYEDFKVEPFKTPTKFDVKNASGYYKDKINLEITLKDLNDTSLINKSVNIHFNGKIDNKTTNGLGKVILSYDNLKPGIYCGVVKFNGDDKFDYVESNFSVKVNKLPLTVKTNSFNTYVNSNIFFKATVFNSQTNIPISGIRVLFKVYSVKTKKTIKFYAVTDKMGVVKLKKNLNVGSYKISTQICDSKNKQYVSYKNSKNKVTMNVKPTYEKGCCSFYVQLSNSESIGGFRRDSTEAVTIHIDSVKWFGKSAIKQYKAKYGYFYHMITTADGWMVGNGGLDSPKISKAIENIAGNMVKSKKIKSSYLKKIYKYKKQLNFGHFSIKAPNGNFAIVWKSGYLTGKLKPGQYLSIPNVKSYYRHGDYTKFNNDPVKAAMKIGATDSYGVNRRDITLFHWKASTDKNFKTTSSLQIYAANDDGKLVCKSTSNLKDHIKYKNTFINKNNLPKSPNMKFIGIHDFGNIDRLIKTPVIIKAPPVTNKFNETKYFKITLINKNMNKVLAGFSIKLKITTGNKTDVYTIKTDNNGIAKFNTKNLLMGSHKVVLAPANNKYLISGSSAIVIKE